MVYKIIAVAVFIRRFKIFDKSERVLIHAHFLSTGLEVAILLKSIYTETTIVGTAHGSDVLFQSKSKVSKLVSEADLIFAASHAVAERIYQANEFKCFDSQSKVIVRYCRVPVNDEIGFEQKRRFTEPLLRILTVARFHPQKGLDIALKTAKLLKDMDIAFYWKIIGDGQMRSKLEHLILDFGLESHVSLLGAKPREDVQIAMRESDIMVLPSVRTSNSSDGLPVVILEAMSSGLYVVTTNVGGITEAIAENRGSIVEADPYLLSNEILRVWRRGASNIVQTNAARNWIELNCLRGDSDPLAVAYTALRGNSL